MYVLNAGTKYNVLLLTFITNKEKKKNEYGTRYLSTVRIKILQFLTNLVY